MGGLFSRFKSGKKSNREILEGIESEIQKLSHRASLYSQYEKNFILYLLCLSFFIYLAAAVVFYFYFIPTTLVDSINVIPLVLFPVVIYGVKKLLGMYFAHKQEKYASKLKELRDEKKKVLDSIMDNEVYKVAVELLERFDPSNPALKRNQEPKREDVRQRKGQKRDHDPSVRPPPSHPAYRVAVIAGTPAPHIPPIPINLQTPGPAPPPPLPGTIPRTAAAAESLIPPGMCLGAAPGPPQPNPILPRERSTFDKVVDYLVGDGPSNRYALICPQCYSHNGMALKDEFEFTAFRCAYCYALTPARKKKPLQPQPSQVLSPGLREATPPVPNPTQPATTPLRRSKDNVNNQEDDASRREVDHTHEHTADLASEEEEDENAKYVNEDIQSELSDQGIQSELSDRPPIEPLCNDS